MRKLLIVNTHFRLFLIAVCLAVVSCTEGENKKGKDASEKTALIIDINMLINKKQEDVSTILGKVDLKESIAGKYPCESKNCERVTYASGKYEVIFNDNKPLRITINDVPDYTSDEDAITKIGLEKQEPSFKNPGTVLRYSNVEGIAEVNFNTNFIYIIINK